MGKSRTTTLLSAAVVVLACCTFAQSAAAWDPHAFVRQQKKADKAFKAKDYKKAKATYLELKWMVESGLNEGRIPKSQLAMARSALTIIVYQVGRCQQLSGACVDAANTYSTIPNSSGLDDGVRQKLPVRVLETELCVASEYLEDGDLVAATTNFSAIDLDGVSAHRGADEELEQARADALARHGELKAQLVAIYKQNLEEALGRNDCGESERALDQLHLVGFTTGHGQDYKPRVAQVCAPPPAAPPPPDHALAYISGGTGAGLILLGAGLTMWASSIESDFESSKRECANGPPTACADARASASDFDTARYAALGSFGLGAIALSTGAVLYYLEWVETNEASLLIAPSPDGANIHVGFRF